MFSLTFSHVTFSWPDGRPVCDDLSFSLPRELAGIVGRNGLGKSTLLRLAAGRLAPAAGFIQRPPTLGFVAQDVTLAVDDTVADALGIGARVRAVRAIEAGSTSPADYDAVGDDWVVEERAAAVLASLGLNSLSLDRTVREVSGGEATLLAVAGALLAEPEVLLLDEPTNNLDAHARERLAVALAQREGATAVVSHDRALLERVDRIGELRERHDRTVELRWFGGAIDAFDAALAAEREAAAHDVVAATADVARQSADLAARVGGHAKRARASAKARANAKVTRAGVKVKADQAAASDARVRREHEERLAAARDRLDEARAAIPRDRSIVVDLPGTTVPPRRRVLDVEDLVTRTGARVTASVVGPERIVLAGRNGSGKTTLVETVLGLRSPVAGRAQVHVAAGYLAQRLDGLDDAASVIDNVRLRAPDAPPQEVRDQLGRFQFRGAAASAPVGTLSGGERFRAALACVLLARPEPQLLVLDEPTNNLDFETQAQVAQALEGYRGALLVVSHDPGFVEAIGPTRRWELGDDFADLPADQAAD